MNMGPSFQVKSIGLPSFMFHLKHKHTQQRSWNSVYLLQKGKGLSQLHWIAFSLLLLRILPDKLIFAHCDTVLDKS